MLDIKESKKVFSVTELSIFIKSALEDTFSHVYIKGEISGLKIHSSGHVYFNLKDNGAVINAVCFKGVFSKVNFKLEEGMEVEVSGRITIYQMRSNYQIIVTSISNAGIGNLLQILEKRKKMLADEGLFDSARKKTIPFFPKTIGIITSPTGAVIQDIIHRLSDRCPTHVLLWPTQVQGSDAAKLIVEAIEGFNSDDLKFERPDVLILARGGGSIEDLWCFNEEALVRAVANSKIPIITAVGHETDTTLVDFASDLRAPTPTAAAEFATPVIAELRAKVLGFSIRLKSSLNKICETKQLALIYISDGLEHIFNYLERLTFKLANISLKLPHLLGSTVSKKENALSKLSGQLNLNILKQHHKINSDKLHAMSSKLQLVFNTKIDKYFKEYNHLETMLNSLSYKQTLKRGYCIALNSEHKIIKSSKEISKQTTIELEFEDGRVIVK